MDKNQNNSSDCDVVFTMYFKHWKTGKIVYTGRPIPMKIKRK